MVKKCYSESLVENTGLAAGGLIGYAYCNSVEFSYTNTVVSGKSLVGGLIGSSSVRDDISNCYSIGELDGNKGVGGLVGQLYYGKRSLKDCISYCSLTDAINTGSFIGQIVEVQIDSPTDKIKIENIKVLKSSIDCIGAVTGASTTNILDYDTSSWEAGIEDIKLQDTSTSLQVGINSESASQLSVNTNFELDLGKVVRNGIGSDSGLSVIDNFINLLSEKQTELGATQNRLESVLDEISTKYENLVSSRSTLRDAEIAEVSAQYIQQQILQQAAATLMSTANQSPSIALQLI